MSIFISCIVDCLNINIYKISSLLSGRKKEETWEEVSCLVSYIYRCNFAGAFTTRIARCKRTRIWRMKRMRPRSLQIEVSHTDSTEGTDGA